jgi:pyridoxal phosphate enzyme (YggS family)
MDILTQYKNIEQEIKNSTFNISVNLVVVTKGRPLSDIEKIINAGHFHFGENRVQESIDKWSAILKLNPSLKLHFIGKLQTNKVTDVVRYFSFMHSLDNEKLALKLSNEEKTQKKNLNYFIQVNLGEENQKSGILKQDLTRFVKYCKNDLKLNIVGLMCLPPIDQNSEKFFKELKQLASDNNLKELSMGMSNDYISAIKNGSTFVRIGSGIFREESN